MILLVPHSRGLNLKVTCVCIEGEHTVDDGRAVASCHHGSWSAEGRSDGARSEFGLQSGRDRGESSRTQYYFALDLVATVCPPLNWLR